VGKADAVVIGSGVGRTESLMLYRRVLFLIVLTALPAISLIGVRDAVNEECQRLEALERSLEDQERNGAALPPGVYLATRFDPHWGSWPRQRIITVREKLAELGARRENGKLYAKSGSEICFYKPKLWHLRGYYTCGRRFREIMDKEINLAAALRADPKLIVFFPPPRRKPRS
jgi:hypothetical protein